MIPNGDKSFGVPVSLSPHILMGDSSAVLHSKLEEFEFYVHKHLGQGSICNFLMSWKTNYPYPVSMITAKNFSFYSIIDYQLKKAIETGNHHQMVSKWQPPQNVKCFSSLVKPLGIEKIGSLYLALLVLTLLSCVVFATEFIISKRKPNKQHNNINFEVTRAEQDKFVIAWQLLTECKPEKSFRYLMNSLKDYVENDKLKKDSLKKFFWDVLIKDHQLKSFKSCRI